MKLLSTFATLLLLLGWIPGTAQPTTSDAPVKVYYFHGNNRCVTCNNMESYTRELLNDEYAKELKSGTVSFEVFNFDDPANSDIVKKYAIGSSTLLIVKTKKGKEKVSDLTEIGFNYAKYEPDKFKAGVREKINTNLR